MMRTDTSPDADHNDLNDLNELRDIEQPRGSLKLMTTDDNDHTDDKTLETGYDSKVRRLSQSHYFTKRKEIFNTGCLQKMDLLLVSDQG